MLLAAAAVALAWANSPWSDSYADVWRTAVGPGGGWGLRKDLRHWVNDGLMTLFFFLIGLEIKRELVSGELADRRAALLPALAAGGGMVVPVVVFLAVAGGSGGDGASRGWAIPMATDIAFAVGVLAVAASRAPSGLKVFLLTLAIVDDLGAIVVIAVAYGQGVSVGWLVVALVALGVALAGRRAGVASPVAYLPVGALCWYATMRAGVHPTIAGAALGMLTPAGPVGGRPVLRDLERRLHPWSSYAVVPLFALANAGVGLDGSALRAAFASRLFWGVALGLVVGKTLGITAVTLGAQRLGVGRLPEGVGARSVVGVAALGGIGFTVALFVTDLAFAADAANQAHAKVAILAGSVVAGGMGAAVLAARRRLG